MLEGTLTARVTEETLFATLSEVVAKELSGGYRGETHVITILSLEKDATDEKAFIITFDRQLKPKETI